MSPVELDDALTAARARRTIVNIEPYRLSVSQDVLDDLQNRLRRTRWPQSFPGQGWDYGTSTEYMRELVEDSTFARPLAQKGVELIRNSFNTTAMGKRYKKRLSTLLM